MNWISNIINQRNTAIQQRNELLEKYNKLVNIINEKGGQDFLDGNMEVSDFTENELKDLLKLCHPDIHNGSELSTRITQRILEIKKTK